MKEEIILAMIEIKMSKYFRKELREMKGSFTSSGCIDGTSNLRDVVEKFDRKYNKVLIDGECH